MPRAFVHGNPETHDIWSALVSELRSLGQEEPTLLSPPGFGAPLPNDFTPTQTPYREWLVSELERLGGEVDLVGHDWGAGHVYGVLDARPDLVRTWAADCAGLIHPDYTWHDMAQAWQTPDIGEQAVEAMLGLPEAERAATWASLGMPADVAANVAAAQGAEMGRAILALYRSAAQPAMAELGARLRGKPLPRGLVVIATEDPYAGSPAVASEVAVALGASTVRIEGEGHWWMFGGARQAAEALADHWG